MITELDIDVLPLTREGQIIGTGMSRPQFQLEEFQHYLNPYANGLPAQVEDQLKDRWAELFAVFFKHRDKIDRVTLWGVTDSMSWKNDYHIRNCTNDPLFLNSNGSGKPALDAVLQDLGSKSRN